MPFTTRDPLDGVNGTTTVANPYHYANNDPLNKTDPTGMRTTDQNFDPEPTEWYCPDWIGLCPGMDDPPSSASQSLDDLEREARANWKYPLAAEAEGGAIMLSDLAANPKTRVHDCMSTLWDQYDYLGNVVGVPGPPSLPYRTPRMHMTVTCVAPSKYADTKTAGGAVTHGHYIFCSKPSQCGSNSQYNSTLYHELVHVDQYEESGDAFDHLYDVAYGQAMGKPGGPSGCANRYEAAAFKVGAARPGGRPCP